MKNIYLKQLINPFDSEDIRGETSELEISQFEEDYNVNLPSNLKRLLLKRNGGIHSSQEFEELSVFFSLNGSRSSIAMGLDILRSEDNLIPNGYIPFGIDEGGWMLIVDGNEDGGGVFIFTNDGELLELSDSLEEYFGVEDISEIEFYSEE